jgi:hypothetical protein
MNRKTPQQVFGFCKGTATALDVNPGYGFHWSGALDELPFALSSRHMS